MMLVIPVASLPASRISSMRIPTSVEVAPAAAIAAAAEELTVAVSVRSSTRIPPSASVRTAERVMLIDEAEVVMPLKVI